MVLTWPLGVAEGSGSCSSKDNTGGMICTLNDLQYVQWLSRFLPSLSQSRIRYMMPCPWMTAQPQSFELRVLKMKAESTL